MRGLHPIRVVDLPLSAAGVCEVPNLVGSGCVGKRAILVLTHKRFEVAFWPVFARFSWVEFV